MKNRHFALDEIEQVAAELVDLLSKSNRRLIALHGEMGAGKTTLTAAMLKSLGGEDLASSPTYSIINQYHLPDNGNMYHMDWYRLRDEEEALEAGVEDPLYSGHWCVVEWPEKAAGLLPEEMVHIYLETLDEKQRSLTIRPYLVVPD